MRKNKIKILIGLGAAFFLLTLQAAFAGTCDLGVDQNKITLSQPVNNLVAGQSVRAYSKVINYGDVDATAIVGFYILDKFIGQAPVSVLKNGVADEVFIDFIVPANDFNIEIKVLEVSPSDSNSKNNTALTQFFQVKKDSDGDGVLDENDFYPNDSTKWKEEPKIESPKPVDSTEKKTILPKPPVVQQKNVASPQKETTPLAKEQTAITQSEKEQQQNETAAFYRSPELELLKEIKIVASAADWNSYEFSFATNVKNLDINKLDFVWNYGDGKEKVINGEHEFPGPGEYFVTLKVLGPFENYLFDNLKISISFWSWKNYWLWLLLAILFAGLTLFFVSLKFSKKTMENQLNHEEK